MEENVTKNSPLKFFDGIKKSITLNLLREVSEKLGLGFASYYFHLQGVDFYKILIIWAISPLSSLPIVIFSNTWRTKRYLALGLLSYTAMSLSLLFFNEYSFLLFGLFNGFTLGFFWVSFNYVFFLSSSNKRFARDSSIYFILGPVIGIILPPLGALIIDGFGYKILFLVTALLSLIPLLYIRGEHFDYTIKQSFRDANKSIKGIKLISSLDASIHFFQGNFLAIYTILFLKTNYEVSGLLSFLAFASLLVSFIVAHISDKFEKRVEILYPLQFIMAALILLVPALNSISSIILVMGIYAIFDNIALPIRFTVSMEIIKPDLAFWRAGEFYGNAGRTVTFALASMLIYLGNDWLAFGLFALMCFALPFIVRHKIKSIKSVNGGQLTQK